MTDGAYENRIRGGGGGGGGGGALFNGFKKMKGHMKMKGPPD